MPVCQSSTFSIVNGLSARPLITYGGREGNGQVLAWLLRPKDADIWMQSGARNPGWVAGTQAQSRAWCGRRGNGISACNCMIGTIGLWFYH